MTIRKVLFLGVIIFAVSSSAFADTIALKSGQTVKGTILERNNESIKVDVEGVTLTYYLDEVATINAESVVSQATQPATGAAIQEEEVTLPPETKQNKDVQSKEDSLDFKTGDQEPAEQTMSGRSSEESDFKKTWEKFPGSSRFSKTGVAAAATIGIAAVLIVLFFVALFYVYSSLCLYLIAKKTAQEPAWLAWIPIGNLFLMCKIGKLSYLWLLPLLVPFVAMPIVFLFGAITGAAGAAITGGFSVIILVMQILSSLAMAALFAFIWYKIALARNKPGWIGIVIGGSLILNLIPFVGILGSLVYLILMGYLTFSE